MAIIEGYSEYICEVQDCPHHDFAKPHTDKADTYALRRRVDENGVEIEVLICAEHNATYSKLVAECEKAYKAFMRNGSYTLATQEEVAELQEALASKTAEYEAVRKNRDLYVRKYNDLLAEYEEYKRTHPDTDGGEQ